MKNTERVIPRRKSAEPQIMTTKVRDPEKATVFLVNLAIDITHSVVCPTSDLLIMLGCKFLDTEVVRLG